MRSIGIRKVSRGWAQTACGTAVAVAALLLTIRVVAQVRPMSGSRAVGPPADKGSITLPAGSAVYTCAPGPERYSQMKAGPGGYPRVRPAATGTGYHQFYFARAMYTDRRYGSDFLGDGGPAWSIDYANADRVMMRLAKRLSNLDVCEWEHPVSLADPDLRRFPFLYSLEWGYAALTQPEIDGLHDYLSRGGFLMIDDFWGSYQWANFEREIKRALPGSEIVEIPRDHLIFRSYYTIVGEILQVPNVGNGIDVGRGYPWATTSEQDGYVAHVRGIFDDKGRLIVAINWNTDLGDAMEWAEHPDYPLQFSRFSSELFMNTIMYAMTQ